MATDLLKAQKSFSAPSSAFFSPTAKQLAHKHLNISFKGRICQLAPEVILKLYTDQNETKEKTDGGNSILAFVASLGFCTLQTFNKILIFLFFFNAFPCELTRRVLELIPTADRRRQGASMDEFAANRRTLLQHLGVDTLLKGTRAVFGPSTQCV